MYTFVRSVEENQDQSKRVRPALAAAGCRSLCTGPNRRRLRFTSVDATDQILELCRERGHVTISDIAKATRANRNTIKDHVTALVEKAHLLRRGAGRGTWYSPS